MEAQRASGQGLIGLVSRGTSVLGASFGPQTFHVEHQVTRAGAWRGPPPGEGLTPEFGGVGAGAARPQLALRLPSPSLPDLPPTSDLGPIQAVHSPATGRRPAETRPRTRPSPLAGRILSRRPDRAGGAGRDRGRHPPPVPTALRRGPGARVHRLPVPEMPPCARSRPEIPIGSRARRWRGPVLEARHHSRDPTRGAVGRRRETPRYAGSGRRRHQAR